MNESGERPPKRRTPSDYDDDDDASGLNERLAKRVGGVRLD